MTNIDDKLSLTMAAIDDFNRQDPRSEPAGDGGTTPVEFIYGIRMSEMLHEYMPHAGATLQIAARGQHIGRWHIPRSSFPMDRPGYQKWRSKLKIYHADRLAEIMTARDWSTQEISEVRDIVIKKGLKSNEAAAALEDVVCLVFLKYYLEDFSSKHEEAKVIDILQKTWGKMTNRCQEWALAMSLSDQSKAVVLKALGAA